jgi:RNA polymerase sigma-70 factor (ECF subfamily)
MKKPAGLPPFWRLVERHGDELIAHARRLVANDAEDVVQDALLKALRSYPRLEHGNHLRAWLYRVTTTTAFDHHARRRRMGEVLVDAVPVVSTDDHHDDGGFEALIADLPRAAREAVTLRFVDDLEYDAIAKQLGCSADAARQRVSSGVRALRKRLA